MGDPDRYCAKLVKFDRFRCADDDDVDIGSGGTGTLMHDGEILAGKPTLFTVTEVGGGGGKGGRTTTFAGCC